MNGPAFINIVVPFDTLYIASAEAAIGSLREKSLGNHPTREVRALLEQVPGLHFMTVSVVGPLCPSEIYAEPDTPPDPPPGKCAHLLFELTSDFGSKVVLPALVECFHEQLSFLLDAAGHPVQREELLPFLKVYEIRIRDRWFRGALGGAYSGTPGLSVERIMNEFELAGALREIIDVESSVPRWNALSPQQQIERVRNILWCDRKRTWKWAFMPEAALPTEPHEAIPRWYLDPGAKKAIRRIIRRMLWPFYTPILLIALYAFATLWDDSQRWAAVKWSLGISFFGFLLLFVAVGVATKRLNHLASTDAVDERVVSSRRGLALLAMENFAQQNHLLSVSRLKRGLLRRLTLRLAFVSLGTAGLVNVPGFLGKNGVIHAARWMRLPFTDQLVFWSNYDGTWQSYVAEFISDAPEGVTGIWSNCVGFPKTKGLFSGGAADEDRTVRWARRQQIPTPFWFSAYPDLSAARIRTNSQIRLGLAAATTYQDCMDWFSLFGSSPKPAGSLDVSQISTLAFGGLSRMRYASCFVVSLSNNCAQCKALLKTLQPFVVYGSAHKDLDTALTVGLSAAALERLGLPREAIETFPVAFKQGMCTDDRSRALGDTDGNAPKNWAWGGPARSADVILLAYAPDAWRMWTLEATLRAAITGNGHTRVHYQRLTTLKDRSQPTSPGIDRSEPFGFTDGISQPVMRGAPQRNRPQDAINLVDPGELILGYPDNLGVIAPGPYLAASCDPRHTLPDAGVDPGRARPDFSTYRARGFRDLGLNGTFLVVRQYQQHVDAFDQWFTRIKSSNISTFAHVNDNELKELLFAKFFGRWKDGASLVRHSRPPSKAIGRKQRPADNDFLCGLEDPAGYGCPFGAHVRRSNPRDTRFPGSQTEMALVNRHRMLRVSRVFGKLHGKQRDRLDKKEEQGVLFMCINGDIERQFEFVQKTWLLNPSLQGLESEVDPIIGRGRGRSFSVPTPNGTVRLPDLPDLTTLIGGGYFFVPSKAVLSFLTRR